MQGGIRRNKHDLLPRYNKNGELLDINGHPSLVGDSNGGLNSSKNGSRIRLTTPMKKLLMYISLLCFVYVFIQTTGIIDSTKNNINTNINQLISDSNTQSQSTTSSNNNFKNDIAKQQEQPLLDIMDGAGSVTTTTLAPIGETTATGTATTVVNTSTATATSSISTSTSTTTNTNTNTNTNSEEEYESDVGNGVKAVKQSELPEEQELQGNSASSTTSTNGKPEEPKFKKSKDELDKQKDAQQKQDSKQSQQV